MAKKSHFSLGHRDTAYSKASLVGSVMPGRELQLCSAFLALMMGRWGGRGLTTITCIEAHGEGEGQTFCLDALDKPRAQPSHSSFLASLLLTFKVTPGSETSLNTSGHKHPEV